MAYLYHIINTGQSNSVGGNASPALSTSSSYSNKWITNDNNVTQLVEPCTGYENRGSVESHATKMCEELSKIFGWTISTALSGEGGRPMSYIKKGGIGGSYAHSIARLTRAKSWALANGFEGVIVPFIFLCNGNSDAIEFNVNFAQDVIQMQADYESDIKALTGQSSTIPLLCTSPGGFANNWRPNLPMLSEQFFKLTGNCFFIGSEMGMVTCDADDAHYKNFSYQYLGQYFARRYLQIINRQYPPYLSPQIRKTDSGATLTFSTAVLRARACDFGVYNAATPVSFTLSISGNQVILVFAGVATKITYATEFMGNMTLQGDYDVPTLELFF